MIGLVDIIAATWLAKVVAQMTTDSNNPTPPAGREPSFGIGKLLFAVFLAVLFLLLGHSMVQHRFFQGGRVHRNGSVGQ